MGSKIKRLTSAQGFCAETGGAVTHFMDLIQNQTGAHIMVVYHSPIEGGRLRGHISLLGAVDTTIEVKKSSGSYYRVQMTNERVS